MKLNRVKPLIPAPKDAQGLYLVVSPEKLLLSEGGSFKGSDGKINVEVWKRKGDDDPTQEDMGDYDVYIYKNGSETWSAHKSSTPSFQYAASKSDTTIDIKLKVKDAFVETKTVTITADGKTGGNTALVFLYKRSASPINAIDWSNTLTYTFATQQLATVPSGWTLNKVPSGTDPIYVTAATAYGTGATDTIAASEWATPVLFVENGEHGLNSASVFLFKRSASKPAKPTATLTYTFATGVLSGSLAGWTQNIPATDGNPCWVIQATAVGTGATDTIAASEWSEQREYVKDGSQGNPGGNTATIFLFKRSATPINAIDWSNTLTYTFATQQLATVPSGWTLNKVPSGTDPIYVTAATAYGTGATDTIAASEWATPVLFVENGEHGLNSASVFLFKRSASKPAKPTATLTYTFATGVLSGSLAGWTQNIPATDGNPCWVIQATAVGTGATDTIAASEWSEQREYVKDGEPGSPGGTGPQGNGITDEKTYYLATTMATGVTRSTDPTSWTIAYQQATPDKPYVWRYRVTYYRDTSPTYTDCELVYSYSSGANANLLEQTNFSSLVSLNEWNAKGYIASKDGVNRDGHLQIATGTQAHNALREYLSEGGNLVSYEELLQQAVTGTKRKLEPSTWYTLSFWSKGTQTKTLSIGAGGYGYGISGTHRDVWLEVGRKYRITVYGYINRNGNTSVDLRTYVWGPLAASSPWSNQSNAAITSGSYTAASFEFTPTATGLHGLESYIFPDASRTGSEYGYVSYYTIQDVTCLFVTHVYPSVIDTSVKGYVDGQLTTLAGDGFAVWPESSGWVRHTYTFKTKSGLDVTANNNVLWRIPPCIYTGLTRDVYICMPKLEVGMQATGYQSNEGTIHSGQLRCRRWALNTEYMAGEVDEPYDDTVAKGTDGLYHCIKAHISSSDNEPGKGTYWSQYWESGSRVGLLATDIFLAQKAVIKNLISELIMTGYEGMPHIEAQGSEFKIFGYGKYPIVELAINDAGKGVLRFLNEETGAVYYDLGPDGITKTLAQDEKITSSDKYQIIGLTDNSDVDIYDAGSYFDNIFNRTKASNNVTYLYTYEAKIVANQFDPGQYCATADDARNANKRIFLMYADTTASGKKYIRDIAPFTGLVCYSWHSATNGGLHEHKYSESLVGHTVYEAEAIPDDYDEDIQGGQECNFMTDDDGNYVDPVCSRMVFHILEGKWNGSKVLYYNKSKVKS